jgi:hypothetical protein
MKSTFTAGKYVKHFDHKVRFCFMDVTIIQYSGKVCERFTPIEDGMRKLGYYNTLYTKVTG